MSTENQDEQQGADDPKTYSEEEFKKVVAQRDAVKAEKTALQAERDKLEAEKKALGEDELKKKGDLQTLLDSKEKEIAKVQTELNEIAQYKTKYEDLDKSIRDSLIAQLPEELREYAEDLNTIKLQGFVELNKTKAVGMDTGRSGKGKISIEGKKWGDFTSAELQTLYETDVDLYNALKKKK